MKLSFRTGICREILERLNVVIFSRLNDFRDSGCISNNYLPVCNDLQLHTSTCVICSIDLSYCRSWDVKHFINNAIKVYPHPSFVYTAKHHPTQQSLIVSGGYDKVLRIWTKASDGLHGKVSSLSFINYHDLTYV